MDAPKSLFALILILLLPACTREAPPAEPRLRHRAYVGPEEIRGLPGGTLAESLVRRLHRECEEAEPGSGAFRAVMAVPAKAFASIARSGFLNQHSTGGSMGIYNPALRYQAEQQLSLLVLPYSDAGQHLLPKYTYLLLRGAKDDRIWNSYGDVLVVFKREVNERLTWTYSDSLHIPFDRSRRGKFTYFPARTARIGNAAVHPELCHANCEGQIWGDLSLRDVDHLEVEDARPIPAGLASLGLPILRYRFTGQVLANAFGESRSIVLSREAVPFPRAGSANAVAVAQAFSGESRIALSVARGRASEAELLWRLEHSRSIPEPPVPVADKEIPEPVDPITERGRLVAELVTRPKSAAVRERLLALTADADAFVRAQAYYGLTELPWVQFRPLLFRCLHDSARLVRLGCVAFAADFLPADPELRGALTAMGADPREDFLVKDWIERLSRPKLCGH